MALKALLGGSPRAHWWMQRISALVLLLLSVWLIAFLRKFTHEPYQITVQWLSAPLNTWAFALWLLSAAYHAALGIQVVLEDYVSNLCWRHTLIRVSHIVFSLIGLASVAALWMIIGAHQL
jgi:succinate dehydrogenase / fumarate reductase, membrane anchor subunit